MDYPYSDDYMVFDQTTYRYYITEKALLDAGIDLRTRLAARKATNPEGIINSLIKTATRHIYGFIHAHTVNTQGVDRIIANVPSARPIMQEALVIQATYVLYVGDLYNSVKPEDKAAAISEEAVQVLGQLLPEMGRSLLYTGV